jgi:hypothetical protein
MSFINKLQVVLKYGIKEQLEARKQRLQAMLNSESKRYDQLDLPQDVSNAGVKKWTFNQFSPNTKTPKPSHVTLSDGEKKAWRDALSKHGKIEDSDVGHFHNLAALVAGRIPATAISKAFVGKDLLHKAISMGNTYFHATSEYGEQSIIGRPENLDYIKKGLVDGQEHMVLRGLGWPESRIPKPDKDADLPIPFGDK